MTIQTTEIESDSLPLFRLTCQSREVLTHDHHFEQEGFSLLL